jgi:hypothetical protein
MESLLTVNNIKFKKDLNSFFSQAKKLLKTDITNKDMFNKLWEDYMNEKIKLEEQVALRIPVSLSIDKDYKLKVIGYISKPTINVIPDKTSLQQASTSSSTISITSTPSPSLTDEISNQLDSMTSNLINYTSSSSESCISPSTVEDNSLDSDKIISQQTLDEIIPVPRSERRYNMYLPPSDLTLNRYNIKYNVLLDLESIDNLSEIEVRKFFKREKIPKVNRQYIKDYLEDKIDAHHLVYLALKDDREAKANKITKTNRYSIVEKHKDLRELIEYIYKILNYTLPECPIKEITAKFKVHRHNLSQKIIANLISSWNDKNLCEGLLLDFILPVNPKK